MLVDVRMCCAKRGYLRRRKVRKLVPVAVTHQVHVVIHNLFNGGAVELGFVVHDFVLEESTRLTIGLGVELIRVEFRVTFPYRFMDVCV